MHIKNKLVNWPKSMLPTKMTQKLFSQFNQKIAQIPQLWERINSNNYSWNLSGLQQIQNLLQVCAKHNKHIAEQLKQLSTEANEQLVSVFKNRTFLKILAQKMQLSPQTTKKIQTLLDKFTSSNSKISPGKLLIIVLFIAMGAQLPLIFEDSLNFKGIILAVSTILDYITTAIQLAQHFQKNKSKN